MMSRKKIIQYISIVVLMKIVGFGLFIFYSIDSPNKEVVSKKLKINAIETIKYEAEKNSL